MVVSRSQIVCFTNVFLRFQQFLQFFRRPARIFWGSVSRFRTASPKDCPKIQTHSRAFTLSVRFHRIHCFTKGFLRFSQRSDIVPRHSSEFLDNFLGSPDASEFLGTLPQKFRSIILRATDWDANGAFVANIAQNHCLRRVEEKPPGPAFHG